MCVCHSDLYCCCAFIVVLCGAFTDCFLCAVCMANDLLNIISCQILFQSGLKLSHMMVNLFRGNAWWSTRRPNAPHFFLVNFNGPENMWGSIFSDALSESRKSLIPGKGIQVRTAEDHSSGIRLIILSLPFADTDTLHWWNCISLFRQNY